MCLGGRVLVFSSNLSSIGYGPVKIRDDPKIYNSANEKNILSPENDFYSKLAYECVKQRICIDLFFCTNQIKSIDIASFAPLH
jgi:protein transport protein SEC24